MVNDELRELLDGFVSESLDSLDDNEIKIANLENSDNEDDLKSLFRVFHTLKGLSGFFELKVINKVTHNAESLLDQFRENPRPLPQETIDLLYKVFDFLQTVIVSVSQDFTDEAYQRQAAGLIDLIIQKENEFLSELDSTGNSDFDTATASNENATQAADLTSTIEAFNNISNSFEAISSQKLSGKPVHELVLMIEDIKSRPPVSTNSEIIEILESTLMILTAMADGDVEPEEDIFIIVASDLAILKDFLNNSDSNSDENPEENSEIPDAEQVEIAASEPMAEAAAEPVEQKPAATPTLASQKLPDTKAAAAAISKPQIVRKDIRVSTDKLDSLFNIVGEMITIETMLINSKDLQGLSLPNFNITANMLNKLTRELQEITMSIRMIPLEALFNKMNRLIRDISRKMNKHVDLEIFGQETEMDKNVIEEISDPLVHMLRNALDHGIEDPAERIKSGKPETGKVKLGAAYQGNEIHIVVEDDGAGLNREKLLNKAIDRGMVKAGGADMSDEDVWQLIFEPGLSTAKEVTDISGRGVGMDVVRKNIDKIRGSIDIQSKSGKGTKITFRIPLTLAIMDAMILRVGNEKYAMPILSVMESFQANDSDISITMDGVEIVKVRGELFPVVRLAELMNSQSDFHEIFRGILLKIKSGDKSICLLVDEILDQAQAVVKPLSKYIGDVGGVTGCMVMPDGKIGLILDADSLIEKSTIMSEKILELAN